MKRPSVSAVGVIGLSVWAVLLSLPSQVTATDEQPELACVPVHTPYGICRTEPDPNNCVVVNGELYCGVITFYRAWLPA